MKKRIWAVAALSLTATLLAPVTSQAKEPPPPPYSQPTFDQWDTTKLDIIIAPPAHGQIYNGNGALNGGDPGEVGIANSYVRATEDSIAEWQRVVRKYGPKYMRKFTLKTYVVGRDEIPQDVLDDPEAIIAFNEHQTFILGVTFSTTHPDCIISNSLFFTASFTYTDMYTVNMHEFGHCLGLEHFEGPGEDEIYLHDLMTPAYVHNPGDAGVHPHCISKMNLKGVVRTFATAFGKKPNNKDITGTPATYKQYTCKAKG